MSYISEQWKKANAEYKKFDDIRFNKVDDDNFVLATDNLRGIYRYGALTAIVLVVGNNKVVFLQPWQVRKAEVILSEDENGEDETADTYRVHLNREHFKVYTFSHDFDDFAFDKEDTFDSLKAVAESQKDNYYSEYGNQHKLGLASL